MAITLTDHGQILHFAGRHHLYPVRGTSPRDIAFAGHGEADDRKPIGWPAFFVALREHNLAIRADAEAGTLTVEAGR